MNFAELQQGKRRVLVEASFAVHSIAHKAMPSSQLNHSAPLASALRSCQEGDHWDWH